TPRADLFSHDYLSIVVNPKLRSMILSGLSNERRGFLGATGTRLLENTEVHVAFEAQLREYYNANSALLFNTGYDAHMALSGALPQTDDVVGYDKLIHASVLDGIRLSRVAAHSFDHNSVISLKSLLQKLMTSHPPLRSDSCSVCVALETGYSMDGDIAPLQQPVEAVENTLAKGCSQIFVDESHSAGMYGPGGRGIVHHLGLEKRIDIRLYIFSKALAGSYSVVICSPTLRTYLINFPRPFMYSTARIVYVLLPAKHLLML
ncbi:pyridoxal phosphate-dependent transferase, partial [Gautieria morchelliformis]